MAYVNFSQLSVSSEGGAQPTKIGKSNCPTSAMLLEVMSRREAPSRATKVSPRQDRSRPPYASLPTLSQGVAFHAEGGGSL